MDHFIVIRIKKLPEGVYLATSDEIQGLVAQADSVAEVLEISADIIRKLDKSE